jgi:hypothetical protein
MRAFLAEIVDVQMDDVPIEAVAQVEQRQIDDATNQAFLAKLKEAFEPDADHDEADDPG